MLGALAIAPGVADAGTYHMYHCRVPGKETGTRGPWTFANAVGQSHLTSYDTCSASGGSFGSYLPGGPMGGDSQASLTLSKDNSHVTISAMKTWIDIDHATYAPYSSTAIASLWLDGVKSAEWSGAKPESPPGNQWRYTDATGFAITPVPAQTVTWTTTCPAGAGCQIYANPYKIYGVDTTLSESVAPTGMLAGAITTAGTKTGTVALQVTGSDDDSGIRKIEAFLDDAAMGTIDYDRDWTKPLSEQQAGTCAYDSWNACPTSQTASLNVNTKLVPDGTYALAARVTDAAGNVTTTAPQTVTIDNVPDPAPPAVPAPPVPGPKGDPGVTGPNGAIGGTGANGPAGPATLLTRNGTNASPQAAITARFVGYSGTAIRASYGKTVRLTGQLLAPGGAPIAGAKATVFQRDKMIGAAFVPHTEVVTDAEGRFAYTTVASRSRTIRFAYRANLEDVDFARTLDVALGVVPRLTLKTDRRSLRNGQAVRFSGAIASAPANAKKVVELQVRKGKGWMTFTTTRLKKGHFAYAYKFKRTRGLVTYQFRARVREEAGFPFLSGHSKTVKVTVRG